MTVHGPTVECLERSWAGVGARGVQKKGSEWGGDLEGREKKKKGILDFLKFILNLALVHWKMGDLLKGEKGLRDCLGELSWVINNHFWREI